MPQSGPDYSHSTIVGLILVLAVVFSTVVPHLTATMGTMAARLLSALH